MKLHTVFISYNRLELLKETIFSYKETLTVPATYVIVDNGSDPETVRWIRNSGLDFILLGSNYYPGYATNRGWELAPENATHLQRSDNDFRYLPEWCDEVKRRFRDPGIGQVGLRTDAEEGWEPSNCGGNNIIRRELWDQGLRYLERPWGQYAKGHSEDSYFSPAVARMGWKWVRVRRPCIHNLASGDWGDEYYQESYGARGIRPHPDDPTLTPELKEKLL